MKPQPTHFTYEEGGEWVGWRDMDHRRKFRQHGSVLAHSIKFEDGSEFDMLNGWRE